MSNIKRENGLKAIFTGTDLLKRGSLIIRYLAISPCEYTESGLKLFRRGNIFYIYFCE